MRDERSIEELSQQLAKWRKAHSAPSPLPQDVWDRAVELAAHQGVNSVARALKLNYDRLRKLVRDREHQSATASDVIVAPNGQTLPSAAADATLLEAQTPRMTWMEFVTPMANSSVIAECSLKVEAARGSKMCVQLKDLAPSSLVAILRGFVEG